MRPVFLLRESFLQRVPVSVPGWIEAAEIVQCIELVDHAGGIPSDVHGKFGDVLHINFFPEQIFRFREIVFPFQDGQKLSGKFPVKIDVTQHIPGIMAADHHICDSVVCVGGQTVFFRRPVGIELARYRYGSKTFFVK